MKKNKSMCSGCVDNFYNGNNPYGVDECWSYAKAEVCKKKFVPLDQCPPWKMPAVTTLSCYKRKGYVKVDPQVTK